MRFADWALLAVGIGALAVLVLYGGPICPPDQGCEWPVAGPVSLVVILGALSALIVRLMRRNT